MNFKKSQSGRSMVEMLGVLAIIGVLSVGGIAGYSLSMRRHRANQVVDILSKFALVAYSSCQQKLLNGDVTALSECSAKMQDPPYFPDSGIGNMPAGVIAIAFDDDKLCQAVGSVAGRECENFIVVVPIKQN